MNRTPSPTGLPVIPPELAPYMAILCAVALAVQQAEVFAPGSVGYKVVAVVVGLGGILGILSAGARKGMALAVVLLAGVAFASPARAQLPGGLTLQAGPSVPIVVYHPGAEQAEQALQLAGGAGVQVSISHPALEKDIGGQRWTLLSVLGMAFGRVVSPASHADFAELSLAGGFCTFSGLACVVAGRPVLSMGPAQPGWFLGLAGGFNFEVGPEQATFAGGAIRANTVRISW